MFNAHIHLYVYTHIHIYMYAWTHTHLSPFGPFSCIYCICCLFPQDLQKLRDRPVSESVMKFTLVRSTRKDFFTSFAIFSELICSICLSKQNILESREAKPCVWEVAYKCLIDWLNQTQMHMWLYRIKGVSCRHLTKTTAEKSSRISEANGVCCWVHDQDIIDDFHYTAERVQRPSSLTCHGSWASGRLVRLMPQKGSHFLFVGNVF